MPSRDHEMLVDLFRKRPALARELLAACAGIELEGANAELGSIDLSQVAPIEFRADALTVLRDRRKAVAAVIVEVQLDVKKQKLLTWPLYVTAARASLGCPVMLVVLAPDRAVARWARRSIATGHPGFTLRPIVIDFRQIPRITDVATARAAPELAVLSAIARPKTAVIRPTHEALNALPEDSKKLYWDILMAMLPAPTRQAIEVLENDMKGYQLNIARRIFLQGRERGLRDAIVEVVCARLPGLREEISSRLRGRPKSVLMRVAAELGKAYGEDDARAVLDRVFDRAKPAVRAARGSSPRRAHPANARPRAGRASSAARAPRTRRGARRVGATLRHRR